MSTNLEEKKSHLASKQALTPMGQVVGAFWASTMSIVFHPVELSTKRWQIHHLTLMDMWKDPAKFKHVLFQDAWKKGSVQQIRSLYAAFPLGFANRFTQWVYVVNGEQLAKKSLEHSPIHDFYTRQLGSHYSSVGLHATAGLAVGFGEVFFMPMNIVKNQVMTNEGIRGDIREHGYYKHLRKEGWQLYKKGLGVTLSKNVIANGAFFATDAAAKIKMGIKNPHDATPGQLLLASSAAAISSAALVNPLDVIKARTQCVSGPSCAYEVFRKTLKKEGFGAFFRGLGPKLVMRGTKTAVVYSTLQRAAAQFDEEQDVSLERAVKSKRPS